MMGYVQSCQTICTLQLQIKACYCIFGVVFQGSDSHPICPVMLGDARLASTFADEMLGKKSILPKEFLQLYDPAGVSKACIFAHFSHLCNLRVKFVQFRNLCAQYLQIIMQ